MRLPFRSILCNHCCNIIKTPTTTTTTSTTTTVQMNSYSYYSSLTTTGNRHHHHHRRRSMMREKVLVIMGPTGSGKSRLSVDIATRFPAEIINSDKIQLYKGLDITTNKIPQEQRLGVPHHLLGCVDSSTQPELTPPHYRLIASSLIASIRGSNKLPLLVGGSNSLIHALLSGPGPTLRYRCCFLWIDVSPPVLNAYLVKRVDEMLDSGMVDELAEFYNSGEVNKIERDTGLRKAIGVPEFEPYFTMGGNDQVLYEEAVRMIKENTCQLAKVQMEKIQRLRDGGWGLHRLDGTESFRAVLEGSKSWSDIWERQVVEPSMKIVKRFLEE